MELVYGGRPALAWELRGYGGPLGAGLALAGLWWLVRDPSWRSYRFLGAAYVLLYVLFLVMEGRQYYLLGYVGVLAAVGAVGFQRRGRRRVWRTWVVGTVSAVLAVVVLGLSTQATTGRGDADAVARAFRTMPDPTRTALVAQDYVTVASLDAYAPEAGLPPAHSTNRGYGYFAPPAEADTDVLYVGADPCELVPYFRSVRPLPGTGAWLLSGWAQPWAAFWPGLRHLAIV